MTLLWPGLPQLSAQANLRQNLYLLRKAIPEVSDQENRDLVPFILADRQTVRVNSQAKYELDILNFNRIHGQGIEKWPEAVALYKGDFLCDFYLPDSAAFEEWTLSWREDFRRRTLDALDALSNRAIRQGDLDDGVQFARRQIEIDNLREPAHYQLMQALAMSGRRAESLNHFEAYRKMLQDELAVEPAPEFVELHNRLRDGKSVFSESELPTDRGHELLGQIGAGPYGVVHQTFQSAAGRDEVILFPDFLEDSSEPERPVFVARENEIEWLTERLTLAVQSQGHVVFVSGDAGSGKTALMQAFGDRGLSDQPDLLVAWGSCNAFTGRGDPYLPFRDILSSITGDVESALRTGTLTRKQARQLWMVIPRTVSAVVERGPALIDTFVSGSALIERTSTILPEGEGLQSRLRQQANKEKPIPGQMEQAELFQQYTNVLCRLANENPILLIIDDLQWTDSGSIDLLFHLGRRLEGARILVVGAYRPEDLVDENGKRHPLRPLLDQFKRTFGDVWLDLNQAEGQVFVDQFLDTEPNTLGDAFSRTLFQHTDGHPLFTVELLRDMQERGDLIRDEEGRWTEGPELAWSELPARVEGVIAERFGRLEEELREILTVAAVEGEYFTAQVVARVQKIQERQLLRTLSRELERQHQLVSERLPIRIGKRNLSRYRFTHTLFQRYLYNDLGLRERQLLHGEIAELLEKLYSGSTEQITVQLARHYAEADMGAKALKYLLEAGDRARSLYAHQEAIDHYRRALEFLKEQGELDRAARTLMKLGLTYHLAFKYRRARKAFDEGHVLWQRANLTEQAVTPPPAPHPLRLSVLEALTLDPTMSWDFASSGVVNQLFSGLLELSPDLALVPDVAQSWEVLDGGLRYIFHLRENVFWSEGLPVTAEDFEYAWKRRLNPETGSRNASLLYDIKGARAFHKGETADASSVGVSAVDQTTLSVELEEPAGYFLYLLATVATFPIPRHTVELLGQAWTEVGNIVTNGPFRLEQWLPEKMMTFSRNHEFHGRARGNIQRVELSVARGQEIATLEEYEADNLDTIRVSSLSKPDLADRVRQRHASDCAMKLELQSSFIYFDTSRPPFDDRSVRRAFAMSTDNEMLCNVVLRGLRRPAMGGYIPPGMPAHSPDISLPFDPEQARRLLAEAGYPGGAGFPTIKAVTWERFQTAVEFLKEQWQEILGIKINWDYTDFVTHLEVTYWQEEGSFQVGFTGVIADYPDPDDFLKTSELQPGTHWQNSAYNRLIWKARRINDQPERMRLYKEADRMLVEEAVIIPSWYGQSHWLVKPWVRNFVVRSYYDVIWKDIIIDPH